MRAGKSRIHGRGLIAARDFEEGEYLIDYTGDLGINADERHGDSRYVVGLSRNVTVDAARTNSGIARFANDPRGSGKPANTVWKIDTRRRRVRIAASKPIKKGEEILISYGPNYWRLASALKKRPGSPSRYSKAPQIEEEALSIEIDRLMGEPKTYEEALRSPDAEQWVEALRKGQDHFVDSSFRSCTIHPSGATFFRVKWS